MTLYPYTIKVRDRESADTAATLTAHTYQLFMSTANKWKQLFFRSQDLEGAQEYIKAHSHKDSRCPHLRDYRIYKQEGTKRILVYEQIATE